MKPSNIEVKKINQTDKYDFFNVEFTAGGIKYSAGPVVKQSQIDKIKNALEKMEMFEEYERMTFIRNCAFSGVGLSMLSEGKFQRII